jgi:hypothetical protein
MSEVPDEQIIKDWNWAKQLSRKTWNRLAQRLANRIADDLEAAGVTEADLDRLKL